MTERSLITTYLDQNIISSLREGEAKRSELLKLINVLKDKGAIFVCSSCHIDECRASDWPEKFVDVLEELNAHVPVDAKASDDVLNLAEGTLRGVILAERGVSDEAKELSESWLRSFQFAQGWLGDVDAATIGSQGKDEIDRFWNAFKDSVDVNDLDGVSATQFDALIKESSELMKSTQSSIDHDAMRAEAKVANRDLLQGLPQNYAQLDEMPVSKIVDYVISKMDERTRLAIQDNFPSGFWSKIELRKEGELAGFAMMLFHCGVTRDRKVRSGKQSEREKRYHAQFRDCRHIEEASRCHIFITIDKGAARLARAVYAYAGVSTEVIYLK